MRLHKRFDAPDEWRLFLLHLCTGDRGREFVSKYSKKQRDSWVAQIKNGETPALPGSPTRTITGSEWWLNLTLDKESLYAAWARPRPLQARPTTEAYAAALDRFELTAKEEAMLVIHASSPKRSITMRQISSQVFTSDRPAVANANYGALAHRLCDQLTWEPNKRKDGSPIWMSVIAEGWQPEEREFEWIMVPSLAKIYLTGRSQTS